MSKSEVLTSAIAAAHRQNSQTVSLEPAGIEHNAEPFFIYDYDPLHKSGFVTLRNLECEDYTSPENMHIAARPFNQSIEPMEVVKVSIEKHLPIIAKPDLPSLDKPKRRGREIRAAIEPSAIYQMSLVNNYLKHVSTERILKLIMDDSKDHFSEVLEAVRTLEASPEQLAVASKLNEIERKESKYPLVTPAEALLLMGEGAQGNASRAINRFVTAGEIFAFHFGVSKRLRIPEFQFTKEAGVFDFIPTLVKIFKPVSDWATYNWFTTFNDDLCAAPADSLADEDKMEDVMDLAGLYVNSTTYRSLEQEG